MTGREIVDVFMYAFEWLTFLYYAKNLFQSRYQLTTRLAVSFGGFALLFVAHQTHNTYVNILGTFAVCLVLLLVLYKTKVRIAVLHGIIIPICLMVSDYATVIIFYNFFKQSINLEKLNLMTYTVEIIVSKLLYFILLVILVKVFSKNDAIKNQNYLPIIILPATNVFIMLVFQHIMTQIKVTSTLFYLWLAAVILLAISSMFFVLNYHLVFKSADEISTLKIEAQKNKIDSLALELVDKSNEDMRVLAHDFKNHLIQLDNAENMEQVHNYIKQLFPSIEAFDAVRVSRNNTLNLIVSKYINVCSIKNINFRYTVEDTSLAYIDITDLSAILNNLMDNAVEAAENSEQKKVELFIFKKNGNTDVIMVENSAGQRPHKQGEELVSSKKDKLSHGIGLKSVKKVINKYSGFYQWEYNDQKQMFKTIVSFYHT